MAEAMKLAGVRPIIECTIIPYFPAYSAHLTYYAVSVGNLSNVYRACSFFTISDLFCIDNARAIGQKIR
jgi:hypothetical protein